MTDVNLHALGPLAPLAGTWEGAKGKDESPDDDRGLGKNDFRERLVLTPTGRIDNHEQVLYGLRYATVAWRLDEQDSFHEENGYWLWDAANKQVMRCFCVPRGITVLAGGTVESDLMEFSIAADLGSHTYGICSNQFLDREFRTVRYELKITVHDADSWSYFEDTQMEMPGRDDLFHHTDANTFRRVES